MDIGGNEPYLEENGKGVFLASARTSANVVPFVRNDIILLGSGFLAL
jgi:hypothetical protein